jgi:hypothetical protein
MHLSQRLTPSVVPRHYRLVGLAQRWEVSMKRYSKVLSSVLGLALLPLLLSCDDPAGLEQEYDDTENERPFVHQKPMTVQIHPAAADIEVGETIRLWAVLHAADGQVLDNDFDVRWSSSRPERVLITDEGYATGVAPGASTIIAESEFGGGSAYMTVRMRGSGRDLPNDEDERKHLAEEDGYRPGYEYRK